MSMMWFLFVVALTGVFLPSISARNIRQLEAGGTVREVFAPWFDCSGKPDGNYPDPQDCTKFISCVGQSYAYERDCAKCHVEPGKCPDGQLNYQHSSDSCEWANVVQCSVKLIPTRQLLKSDPSLTATNN